MLMIGKNFLKKWGTLVIIGGSLLIKEKKIDK